MEIKITDVKVGNKYMLIRTYSEACKDERLRGKIERFEVTINWIEDRGDEYYFGYTSTIQNPWTPGYVCAFGNAGIKKVGQYKCINIRIEEVQERR